MTRSQLFAEAENLRLSEETCAKAKDALVNPKNPCFMVDQMKVPKKKVDYFALNSPFMRIPQMRVEIARGLLDLGLQEIFELNGRSPEWLCEAILKQHPDYAAVVDMLPRLRLAVYFSEHREHEPTLLRLTAWMN